LTLLIHSVHSFPAKQDNKGGGIAMKTAFILLALIPSLTCAEGTQPVLHNGDHPIGSLGCSLGGYLTIEGVRAERGKVGNRTILVDTVNGKKLDKPVGIWIDDVDLPPNLRCTIKGYETMQMIGRPPAVEAAAKEAGKSIGLPPQAGWQVSMHFMALSSIAFKTAVLKSDPATALQSVLPKGWAILKVDENAYPADLAKGKGKAIFLGPRGEENVNSPWRSQGAGETGVIVYIMPADYQDGSEYSNRYPYRTIPAKLIATIPAAKIYLWVRSGQQYAPGWPGMWNDILTALLEQK
jgi:hypothetical protein